jgi:hypothetical protein
VARIIDVVAIQRVQEAVRTGDGQDGFCHSRLYASIGHGEKQKGKEGDDRRVPRVHSLAMRRGEAGRKRECGRGRRLGHGCELVLV